MAALSASLSFFVVGEVRGWASPAIPSLQGCDGLNNSLSYAPLSKERASWISEYRDLEYKAEKSHTSPISKKYIANLPKPNLNSQISILIDFSF